MGFSHLCGLVTLTTSLTWTGTAAAEPSAADREAARAFMSDARTARDHNDLARALKGFQSADLIMHVPTTGFEVARAQAALGLLVEARDTVRRLLLIPGKADDPEPFREARANAERLEQDLKVRVPSARFILRGIPEGSSPQVLAGEIPVPGAALGSPFGLNPGHHEIVARVGAAEIRRSLDLKEGDSTDLVLDFGGPASPPAPKSESVITRADQPGSSHAVLYTGIGLGIVGVAVGSITGLLAASSKSAAESGCTDGRCPRSTWPDLDRAHSMATLSTIGFIAGGVGAGIAVTSLLFSKDSKNTTGPQVGTHLGINFAHGPALHWRGEF